MNEVLAAVAALLLIGAAEVSTLDRVMGALAERKHGQQRRSAGRVGRFLSALDTAFAEAVLILRETLGEIVAHEGRSNRTPPG